MSWTIVPEFRLPDEPEALAYIAAVEAADGQSLEPAVKLAYNTFIKGCKADGIWDAIKASCILAGARTLAGALVPLVGTAPTNYNFVAGDYNRETGLVGDASTKYLDSNRNNNADPQNNQHFSVYLSTTGSGTALGSDYANSGTSTIGGSILRCRNSSSGVSKTIATGFNGVARSLAASFTHRSLNTSTASSIVSEAPASSNIHLFASNNATPFRGSHRISFYSIGESLDLALLDARVTTLMSDLAAAIV